MYGATEGLLVPWPVWPALLPRVGLATQDLVGEDRVAVLGRAMKAHMAAPITVM